MPWRECLLEELSEQLPETAEAAEEEEAELERDLDGRRTGSLESGSGIGWPALAAAPSSAFSMSLERSSIPVDEGVFFFNGVQVMVWIFGN